MKVTIVGGAGGVGASAAFNLLHSGRAYEVVLVDASPAHVASHAMDFEQVLEQSPGGSVRAGSLDDVADADVLVVTASAPLTVNTSRLVYLPANARILDELAKRLRAGWPGVAIVVTNPVDPLVTLFQSRTGIDRRRVLGYTLNDSLRLRSGVARALGVAPGSVEAWVLGEHGDESVLLLDRVTVDGKPVRLEPEQAAAAEEYVRTWYVKHVALDSGRSSTWTSGLGIARMVDAIAGDAGETWPASLVLRGEYGIDGVAVGVPVTLGRSGARAVVEWTLADGDLEALRASAESVRSLVEATTTAGSF